MVGLCSWALQAALRPRFSVKEQIEILSDSPFDGIDILADERTSDLGSSVSTPLCLSVTLKPLLKLSLVQTDPENMKQAKRRLTDLIATLANIGATEISMTPGPISLDCEDLHALQPRIHEAIAALVEEAKAQGTSLIFENLPGHWFGHLDRVREAKKALPDLAFCLDSGNTLVDDKPIFAWLETLQESVQKVHISDGLVSRSSFFPTALGMGNMNSQEQRALLARTSPKVQAYLEPPPGFISNLNQKEALVNLMREWTMLCEEGVL